MTDFSQNQSLFQQYQASRDRKVRDLLFKINENLIHSVISKMAKFGWEYDDFYQLGAIGLLRSIDRFDIDNGAAFSSFAMPNIRGEILHHIRDKFGLVKIPRHWYDLYRRGAKFVATHRQNTGNYPTEAAILAHLDITSNEWRDVVFANAKPESLDVLLPDSECSRLDLLEAPEKVGLSMSEIEEILNSIEPKFAAVIRETYLKERTDRSVAGDFGVSPMTIRRWKLKALRSMRSQLGHPPRN